MAHRLPAVRRIAVLVATALALSVAAPIAGTASAADPLPPLADPTAPGAVCEGAPQSSPFQDIGAESASTQAAIRCLVATGLTSGTTATTYSPGGTVTRRQMALFVKRLADLFNDLELEDLNALPPYDRVPDYPDVLLEEQEFREAIGQLTQANIVGGFPDGTYRPDAFVSRRQMAAFINRLQDFLTGSPYAATGDYFDDDDADPGEGNLNALASVGIFQGDGNGNVNPGGDLTRRQMANILLRDAQVLYADELIASPFGVPRAPAAPATRVTNQDAGEIADDVEVIYQRPGPNPETVEYSLQRAPASGGPDGFCGNGDDPRPTSGFTGVAGATEAAGTGDDAGRHVFTDADVPQGCYAYRIVATNPANDRSAASPASHPGTAVFPRDSTAPQSVYAAVTTSGGNGGLLDAGDVVTIVFDERIEQPTDGATLQLRDDEGFLGTATITAGSTGTFAVNSAAVTVDGASRPAGTVLVITLANAPSEGGLHLQPGVQLPATVTGASGIHDLSRNNWDVGGSPDTELEVDT